MHKNDIRQRNFKRKIIYNISYIVSNIIKSLGIYKQIYNMAGSSNYVEQQYFCTFEQQVNRKTNKHIYN